MTTQLTLVRDRRALLQSLPAGHSIRWVAARKAEVVEAVETGLLRLDEALARYRLSLEEFETWRQARKQWAMRTLRSNRDKVRGFGRKGLPQPPIHVTHSAL